MFFVERLEGMLANGKKLPLTSSVVVDQAAALELIDELRHAIPEEVQSARRINAEGERILERANQEAERIVARAQEQATQLIDEQGLTEAAEVESRRLVAEAEADAGQTRQGADDYAADVLLRLEAEVSRVLGQIERGIDALGVRDDAGPAEGEETEEPAAPIRGMTSPAGDALIVNVAGLLGEAPGSQRDVAVEVADARPRRGSRPGRAADRPGAGCPDESGSDRVRPRPDRPRGRLRAVPGTPADPDRRPDRGGGPAPHRPPVRAPARHDRRTRGRSASPTTTSSTSSRSRARRSSSRPRSPRSAVQTAEASASSAASTSTPGPTTTGTPAVDPRLAGLLDFRIDDEG